MSIQMINVVQIVDAISVIMFVAGAISALFYFVSTKDERPESTNSIKHRTAAQLFMIIGIGVKYLFG